MTEFFLWVGVTIVVLCAVTCVAARHHERTCRHDTRPLHQRRDR